MTANPPDHMESRTVEKTNGKTDTGPGGALIGYARVSTAGQDTALQMDALDKAGCARVFQDIGISGARADRPGLSDAMAYLRPGDTLVVWKLDRLGRSLPHLIDTVTSLAARGVAFRSLSEAIATDTPSGRLMLHMLAALAQFERDLIRERVQAGLTAARDRGSKAGRRRVMTPGKLAKVKALQAKGLSMKGIAAVCGVSRTAIYDALALEGKPAP